MTAPLPMRVLATTLGVLAILLLSGFAGASRSGNSPGAAPPAPALVLSALSPVQLARLSLSQIQADGATVQPWTCHGMRAIGTAACGDGRPPGSLPAQASPEAWGPLTPAPPAQTPYTFALTYDASDGYVVLLGQESVPYGTPAVPDMWKFVNGTWSPLSPGTMPQFCTGSSLAYDDADGYVVFFGSPNFGYSAACASANETWTYHAGVWTQLHPTTTPVGRYDPAFVNDTADGYLVLFGGVSATCTTWYEYCNDTWAFKAGAWTQLAPSTTPQAREEAGIAYDAAAGSVIMFGGSSYTGNLNDTWSFAGGNWTQLHPLHSPNTPTPDGLTYDVRDQELVYTSAQNYSGPFLEYTWVYSAADWSQVTASGPPERLGEGITYDGADGYVVFFGGVQYSPVDDTWNFSGGIWTNITAPAPGDRIGASETYDAADRYLVLFGGLLDGASWPYTNYTWTYSHGTWTELPLGVHPSQRYDAGMVYDAADGYVLLFGGSGPYAALNDTWEFTGGTWTQLTPTTAPSPRTATSMVYDGADGYVLLEGGSSFGDNSTWSYHAGVWTNLTGSIGTAPPGSTPNPMVYDAADGYVLLVGTGSLVGNSYSVTGDTWSFLGGKWTDRTSMVGTFPTVLGQLETAATYDANVGDVLFYAAGETWTYSANTYTELFPTITPGSQGGPSLAWDAGASEGILVGTGTWAFGANISSTPAVYRFSATLNPVDAGVGTTLSVQVYGGTGVYTYSYAGLPVGCTSANTSTLPCTPAAAGAYSVNVTVVDSAKNATSALLGLSVVAPVRVTGVTVSNGTVAVGNRTVLTVSIAGGVTPYTYNWTGLPPGCSSQDVPVLPCIPSSAGTYLVRATVTDGDDLNGTSGVNLTVTSVGTSGGPVISQFSATPAAFVLGNSTNFTVVATGPSGLSYSYVGLPTGCTSANVSAFNCSPTASGTYHVTATVTDPAGASAAVAKNVTVYPIGGGPAALITGFGPTPGAHMVGEAFDLSVTASGGVGVLSYAYAGLPAGCTSADVSILSCTPHAVGTFHVEVVVTDAASHAVGAFTTFAVTSPFAAVTISSFTATPSTVVAGATMVFIVSVSGGDAPLSFTYSDLPTGCANADQSALSCTPNAPGSYNVHVAVNDSVGSHASANVSVTVLPAATVPPSVSSGTGVSFTLFAILLSGIAVGGVAVGVVSWLRMRRMGRTPPEE